jgi:hypothetical protein
MQTRFANHPETKPIKVTDGPIWQKRAFFIHLHIDEVNIGQAKTPEFLSLREESLALPEVTNATTAIRRPDRWKDSCQELSSD